MISSKVSVIRSLRSVGVLPYRSVRSGVPQVEKESKVVDPVTHTGQTWDGKDYRLARFNVAPKQVNPNFAIDLIAKVPPTVVDKRVISCDGGGGALGHPKVYINLDKPGTHACGYCGLRFKNAHHPESENTYHIQA